MADVLGHLLGAGGAVEPDHRHAQRVDDGVAAPMSVPTSMAPVVSMVTWTISGSSRPRRTKAWRQPLTAALICSGSWQVSISSASTAGDQALGLDREGGLELAVADVAEARQLGAGADRADHEPLRPVAGEALDRLAGEARRTLVDLEARASRPNSPSVIGEPPKLLVSTASAPAAR